MTTRVTSATDRKSSRTHPGGCSVKAFKKVLIANRGAIATRIIRTLQEQGIASVAVYAEADVHSLHVDQADEAYSLGDGPAASTYLSQDKLLAICKQSGAEAIHPGYGFLSENPEFTERCEQQGIVFIGPTPAQMRMFGLKHHARELARQNDVPLVPGSGLLPSLNEALKAASDIGYPLMLKSTAGGGGIGMQVVSNDKALRSAFESVKRLSANNFANDGVFLEKYIAHSRHIEVQVIGDGCGKVITLGERDCSSQRRHQKVIEESPAPQLAPVVRAAMIATASRLMTAVNYRNAGTVEFIYDNDDQQFYFLEVNTRLQVEHGVTEMVWGVDLVDLMLAVAANQPDALSTIASKQPQGHAIQVRIYAEDPNKNFQPCAGLLTQVNWPVEVGANEGRSGVRIDHWIEAGLEITPFFDPMLAKVIVKEDGRNNAINKLDDVLKSISIYGVETNLTYVSDVLACDTFQKGNMTTRFLNGFEYQPATIDVLVPGTQTTIQDYPGRVGYWDVGVPPSGPFDPLSFRLGNRLLGNDESASGLEITLNGPTLKFNAPALLVLTGAEIRAELDGKKIGNGEVISVCPGHVLHIGKVSGAGARTYLLVKGGFNCPQYLGSQATFTLGQFGGHGGRALRLGDVLHLADSARGAPGQSSFSGSLPGVLANPKTPLTINVTCGPQGVPDFLTEEDMEVFFNAAWEVHYHSSRTGIRLIGPKPNWARSDGGEAGMHPSNLHDNAYAIGSVDFTGDMPVILGPDGPSLGGFVCPVTVIRADLWKLGQLKAGDKIRFNPVSVESAVALLEQQEARISRLEADSSVQIKINSSAKGPKNYSSAVLGGLSAADNGVSVVYRRAGDSNVLVEYGEQVLDLRLRLRVHGLMQWLQQNRVAGMLELTPGIRSLQVHYDCLQVSLPRLLAHLQTAECALQQVGDICVPSRIVHLPLSWNDSVCQQAIEKYMQSVRKDAPWCPDNIEFIRRINGLTSVDQVKKIVFAASYAVMGLGDVYLGAPVATPLDPRHRLVTTKYNPARTWTAENSVGIGGAYLCVYGMEGPGGYQFVGRTLQMWNRYHQTAEFSKPWLLRFFDQIRFYEVSEAELKSIRQQFPKGKYPLRIEETEFSLHQYQNFLAEHKKGIAEFVGHRTQAFNKELDRWIASGQINYQSESSVQPIDEEDFTEADIVIESPAAGNVWKVLVKPGERVSEGQIVAVLESMKMEIDVRAHETGVLRKLIRQEGQQVHAGQPILVLARPEV